MFKKIATTVSILIVLMYAQQVKAETIIENQAGSAEITVSAEINSTFTVGIPVKVSLDVNNETSTCSLSVKGDLDPNYELVITPLDGYTNEEGDTSEYANFLLKDVSTDNSLIPKKKDIVVNVTQEKTRFQWSEINPNNAVSVDTTFTATKPITAGKWKSVIEYAISLVEIDKVAGLYDVEGNLICSWDDSGINLSQDYTPDTCKTSTDSGYYVLKNNYPDTRMIVLPDSANRIGSNMFCSCENLVSVIIPDGVDTIGEAAFQQCANLEKLVMSHSVATIENAAFMNCISLASVTIPSSVTSIGKYIFQSCSSLTSVTIPNGINKIEDGVFAYCSGLTSVVIPDSITSIGNVAFYSCTNLTSLVVPDSVASIGNAAFYNVPHIEYNGEATGSPWGAVSIN